MDSMGIPNDKNTSDGQSREMQLLVPPTPQHIVIVTPEQTTKSNGNEERTIPRNLSTGTMQELQLHRQLSRVASSIDLTLSRRPSAAVAAMQRPSVQRSLFMEYVRHYQSVIFTLAVIIFN